MNEPKLRFPEFSGEWEEKKLGEVVNSFKTGKLDANAMVEGGKYRFYTCAKDYSYIDSYAFEGDSIMIAGNGAHLGYVHHYDGKFNAYQRTYVLNNFKCDSNYLENCIRYYLPNRIRLEKKEGNMPYIVLSTLTDMTITTPPTPAEQRKIASCLSAMDDLIAVQAEKVDALKEKKTGLMQQLFPQHGETTPRLRFPEFTGEWETKKLGEAFRERIEKNRGDLPLLSLGEKGLVLQSETERKDNSNSDKSKYLRVAIGDIAYNTMRMWQGRCVHAGIEGIVSPAYTVCEPNEGINSLFHYYLFKTQKMIQIFHQNSQGLVSDTLNLKYEAFSKIRYFLPPSPAEQQKIASCLSTLDDQIAAETEKLTALKDYKKGLLQQLFPQPAK